MNGCFEHGNETLICKNLEKFLTRLGTVSFSKRTSSVMSFLVVGTTSTAGMRTNLLRYGYIKFVRF